MSRILHTTYNNVACDMCKTQHATCSAQHVQHTSCSRPRATCNIHHAACSVVYTPCSVQQAACSTHQYSTRRRTCDTHRTACNRGTPPGWQGGLRRLRTCAASLTFAASSSAVARVFRQPWCGVGCGVVCKYDSARVLSAAKRNRPLHPFA